VDTDVRLESHEYLVAREDEILGVVNEFSDAAPAETEDSDFRTCGTWRRRDGRNN
jgi:hypothetical protein